MSDSEPESFITDSEDEEEPHLPLVEAHAAEDEDDEDNEMVGDAAGNAMAVPGHLIQMHNELPGFLNVGMRPVWRMRRPSDTNDLLVQQLITDGTISKCEVGVSMKCCPRDQFVPGGQAGNPDVFADSPMRLASLGFNVSAPHIHASCLEALDLEPGHRVLDVGSGSGLLSAYAARLVGRRGKVVGIDTKPAATKLATDNIARQVATNSDFALRAAPCEFHTRNVFLPGHPFASGFDRIVVGASAPPDKLKSLLGLLKPGGGVIVTPVMPSDLNKICKLPDGSVKSSLISKVRFSDLEVPKDGEIIKAVLDGKRAAFLQPPTPRSTFASDVASITGSSSRSLPGSSVGSGHSHFSMDSPSPSPTWAGASPSFLATRGIYSCNSSSDMDIEDSVANPNPLSMEDLGPYDCRLVGNGWSLPAHMSVLRVRCDLFRAQSQSGMRDACATQIRVPEEFPKEVVSAFLGFCRTDQLEEGLAPQDVALCLSVAIYYGNAHLVQLCELALVQHLREQAGLWKRGQHDKSGEAPGLAASLLALAEENGLPHLQACCLDFIVKHHTAVAETAAYGELSKKQTDLIVTHACTQLDSWDEALADVA